MKISLAFIVLIALSLCQARGEVTAGPPAVVYADATAVKRAIASDHGQVVLVNFWATWCPPCCAEYPSLVKLDQNYRGKGLCVIGVSLDLQEDINGKVKPFVAKNHAEFRQFVLKVDDPAAAMNAFDPSWQGDIPRTFVYSRNGKLIKILADEQTYANLVSAIKVGLGNG